LTTNQKHPKESRLLKASEYQFVYQQGDWVSNRELVANFYQHNTSVSKLGITVSKKVSKLAVDRNRIKRQIREWFRKKDLQKLSIHLIVTAKPNSNSKTNREIQHSLEDLWRKVQKKCS